MLLATKGILTDKVQKGILAIAETKKAQLSIPRSQGVSRVGRPPTVTATVPF